MRRGFTLVELLVVVGIIAVLAFLALPGILSARHNAAATVGQANMHSLSQLLSAYSADHRGDLYGPAASSLDSGPDSTQPNLGYLLGYESASRFSGEGFAAYWYSIYAQENQGHGMPAEVFVSPADGDLVSDYRSAGAAAGSAWKPGSFYYSPTFFMSPDAYNFTRLSAGCCSSPYGTEYRGNRCDVNCQQVLSAPLAKLNVAQISFPSAKVMLFERADFLQKTRVRISSDAGAQSLSQPRPPAWNNPRARPSVATSDGAVRRADCGELTRLAAEAKSSSAPELEFLPVDLLAVADRIPMMPTRSALNLDLVGVPTDGLYPYFFAGTRQGLRGRDLPK